VRDDGRAACTHGARSQKPRAHLPRATSVLASPRGGRCLLFWQALPFSASKRGYYDLAAVQRVAHAKHGDAATILALQEARAARAAAQREANEERRRKAQEGRLEEAVQM